MQSQAEHLQRRPRDFLTVTVEDQWETDYWCRYFQCTPKQLKDAMLNVGNSVNDLRRQLLR